MSGTVEAAMVLTSVGTPEDARRLARVLVEERLAACVQVLPIESTYRWQGEVHEEGEVLLLAKTRADRYEAVQQAIVAHHPYETPEVVMLPVAAGLPAYLAWLDECLSG